MSLCASGILMSALSLGLILADIYNDRINYITEHAILGGIVSILFFTMCSYGYEIVNWVLLSIIPIFYLLPLERKTFRSLSILRLAQAGCSTTPQAPYTSLRLALSFYCY